MNIIGCIARKLKKNLINIVDSVTISHRGNFYGIQSRYGEIIAYLDLRIYSDDNHHLHIRFNTYNESTIRKSEKHPSKKLMVGFRRLHLGNLVELSLNLYNPAVDLDKIADNLARIIIEYKNHRNPTGRKIWDSMANDMQAQNVFIRSY